MESRGRGATSLRGRAGEARYTREILDAVDLTSVVEELPSAGAGALMCVERDPEACHRSIIAERLEAEYGVAVRHLRA